MIVLCFTLCLALSRAKRDGVEVWSAWQAGIPHPLVTVLSILTWAGFLICLKNQALPCSFLAALPWTLLRMKDLTAFSSEWVFIFDG